MVLDNSSAGNDNNDFSDGAPNSDNDPYSTSEPQQDVPISVELSKLPRPVPVFGRIFGYNDALMAKGINLRMSQFVHIMQRGPTQDEGTAVAYWTAKQISVMSWGHPIGVSGGLWRTWTTRDTFRFPFATPDLKTFNPEVWPSAKMRMFTGAKAVSMWHVSRLAAYVFIGNIVGQVLFGSYALSVSSVGELSDPRLKEYVAAIRTNARNARGKLPGQPPQAGVGDTQQQDSASLWKGKRVSGDDAGSTSGTYGDADDMQDSKSVESEFGSTQSIVTPPPPASQVDRTNKVPAQPQSERSGYIFDEVSEDASPTGGRGTADAGTAGGSTWARIRQQANTQPAEKRGSSWPSGGQKPGQAVPSARDAGSQGATEDGGSPADEYSFSNTAEERQLAKDEAQKTFDARVERERRGGDFTTENGDQKRW